MTERKKSAPFRARWSDAMDDSTLTPAQRGIARALAEWSNADGTRARPGNVKIARKTGHHVNTIAPHLQKVEEAGFIRAVVRADSRKGQATHWQLTIPGEAPPSVIVDPPSDTLGAPQRESGGSVEGENQEGQGPPSERLESPQRETAPPPSERVESPQPNTVSPVQDQSTHQSKTSEATAEGDVSPPPAWALERDDFGFMDEEGVCWSSYGQRMTSPEEGNEVDEVETPRATGFAARHEQHRARVRARTERGDEWS